MRMPSLKCYVVAAVWEGSDRWELSVVDDMASFIMLTHCACDVQGSIRVPFGFDHIYVLILLIETTGIISIESFRTYKFMNGLTLKSYEDCLVQMPCQSIILWLKSMNRTNSDPNNVFHKFMHKYDYYF